MKQKQYKFVISYLQDLLVAIEHGTIVPTEAKVDRMADNETFILSFARGLEPLPTNLLRDTPQVKVDPALSEEPPNVLPGWKGF